jgi:hypothetical protein
VGVGSTYRIQFEWEEMTCLPPSPRYNAAMITDTSAWLERLNMQDFELLTAFAERCLTRARLPLGFAEDMVGKAFASIVNGMDPDEEAGGLGRINWKPEMSSWIS